MTNSETNKTRVDRVETLFHGTGDDYDEVVKLATWGRDAHWKEELLALVDSPRRVLDLACGTGILALEIARRFDCHVTGVELRAEYLDICRARAAAEGLDTRFIHSRAEAVLLEGEQFDHVTSCYLPKYANLPELAANISQMLAPGGLWVMQDFSFPSEPAYQRIFFQHFDRMKNKVSAEDWTNMWSLLPSVIEKSRWIEQFSEELQKHGFVDINVREQAQGMSTMVWGRKPAN